MKYFLPDLLKVILLFVSISFAANLEAQTYANATIQSRGPGVQDDPEKRSLSKILFILEDAYHVSFNYDDEIISNIYLDDDFTWEKSEKLEKVLARLLSNVKLKFERLDKKNYLILEKDGRDHTKKRETSRNNSPDIQLLSPSSSNDENISEVYTYSAFAVSGVVREVNGDPLPGVNVIVKGTSTGTTTDASGAYRIEAPDENSVLVFSFVGYSPQEVAVANRSIIDVALEPDIQSLAEVVVMGYNTQNKKDVTGSVVTVKAEDLKSVPVSNFANQLQGRAPGVLVSNDNTPGGGVAVRIRGIGSITGNNEPLYVIDGVPTTGNLNQLNPNDIESMQVLKDASAASIYGARANNGVIVITTKKGKAGQTKISYSMYEGVQVPNKGPDLLNSQQLVDIIWADYKSRGLTNPATGELLVPDRRFGGGATGVIPDYILSNGSGVNLGDAPIGNDPLAVYTNDPNAPGFNSSKFMIYQPDKNGFEWYDAIYDPAPIRNHNITVSGGSEQGRFAVSADYFQQNGILIHNNFKRYSVRANTEFSIKDVIRFGENIQLSYTDNVGVPQARTEFSPAGGFTSAPFIVPFDIAGNYVGERLGGDHAISTLERNKDNHGYNTRIFGNVYAEADLFKVITARTSIGLDYNIEDSQTFSAKAPESSLKSQIDELEFNWRKGQTLTWTNTLNYLKEFGNHGLQILVGTEAVTSKWRNVRATKNTLPFQDAPLRYFDAATENGAISGGGIESSLFSFFGKVDYKFRERYLVSATIRRDASSRFSPSNRWGTFPAFSLGWIVSEESFMQPVSFITSLKLRGGWGITGNQDIDEYNQYTTFAYSNTSSAYPINGGISGAGNLYTGFEARRLGNPHAQWEEQAMANVGLDVTFFDRLSFTAEWYNRKTDKLLLVAPAPAMGGANEIAAANVGAVTNKGIDLALTYDGKINTDFTYGIGLNWSTYNNEVSSLYDATNPFIPGPTIRQQVFTRTQVGKPLSSFFGMINEGVFHSQEEADNHPTQFGNRSLYNQAGRMKYRDLNGDGIVNGDDVTFIGNPHPDFTYGINLTAAYRGFDFTLFLFGVSGNDIYNFKRQGSDLLLYEGNKSTRILDYWTPDNPDSNVPTPNQTASSEEYYRTSTYFIESGSYLRAKNLQIGYTLPSALISKINVDRIRVYVQGSNLFTITDYTGLDPEINLRNYNERGNEIDRGVDRGVYPAARVFMIGAQIGF